MEYSPEWLTVADAQAGILTLLRQGINDKSVLSNETETILPALIILNEHGFLTHESQPYLVNKIANRLSYHSAWVTGFYPTIYVQSLADHLININPNIMICQVTSNGNMYLYNYVPEQDDPYLIYGHWPDFFYQKDDGTFQSNTSSYSGYIKSKPIWDEFLEDASPSLLEDLKDHSLINIWSRKYDDPLFPTLVQAMEV